VLWQELADVVRSLGAQEGDVAAVVQRTLVAADADGDMRISLDEFRAAVGPVFERGAESLRAAFALFDTDRSGSIDLNEFGTMLGRRAATQTQPLPTPVRPT
jgi:Ca2+-binding EF-hand superfamily protein